LPRARGRRRAGIEGEPKQRLVGDAERPIAITIERVRDRDLSAEP